MPELDLAQALVETLPGQSILQAFEPIGNRFEKEASFWVLCGLCVRYCDEVKKKNAVSFFDNGSVRQIKFVPEVAKPRMVIPFMAVP